MADVEKVARALCRYTWQYDIPPGRLDAFVEQNWRDSIDAATAALAAMGEREANDTSYRLEALEMWAWGGRHNMPEHTRRRLPASPRPEAVEEAVKAGDWRAVDDAIWFFLGHENHKPEEAARLRRMSGVVLGLATEGSKG